MCGISGIISLDGEPVPRLERKLKLMNDILAHRGPDDEGIWCASDSTAGVGHRRLSIIDLTPAGAQPMKGANGSVITYNGAIYNHIELRRRLLDRWCFQSRSDTETILAAHDRYGSCCLEHLRGMFSFAIWDDTHRTLLAARDRCGIKPFYYAVVDRVFYFASEVKALLPFLPEIETEPSALAQYLTFQFGLNDLTMFKGVSQLLPGHRLSIVDGEIRVARYWDVGDELDRDHSVDYFKNRLRELLCDSIALHLRSEVPVGAYLSGGLDSSLVAVLAAREDHVDRAFFHGKFTEFPGYDESGYAETAAQNAGGNLSQIDITAKDFSEHIDKVVAHLDYPIAGPGSFPQYMVSGLASNRVKVVLGGQGGDEIFGGYARYLIAYLEQGIRSRLDGTDKLGAFDVMLESMIPNLGVLKEYLPLVRKFCADGLFGELPERYFCLIDRSSDMGDEICWDGLNRSEVREIYRTVFTGTGDAQDGAFDRMTRFDFKTLLPALLQVEDRMSMAHGLESRVPLLDHSLVEFVASAPAAAKFKDGQMKYLLKSAFSDVLPARLLSRRDKMGFPVPLKEWFQGELKPYLFDLFSSQAAKTRSYVHPDRILKGLNGEARFSRRTWGLLNLELWHRHFHDKAPQWRALLN